MAFGTWFKNLITKGKQFIKKASPYIRKGVDIARRIAPMIGGPVGGVINGIANGVNNVMNLIDKPKNTTKPSLDNLTFDIGNKIEMINSKQLGGNRGRLRPILK